MSAPDTDHPARLVSPHRQKIVQVKSPLPIPARVLWFKRGVVFV